MRATTRRQRPRAESASARLSLVRGGLAPSRDDPAPRLDPRATVAREVAGALLGALDEEGAGVPIPIALPVCMERHAVDAVALMDAMVLLRTAMLAVSGLDRACEPVPLAVGDAGTAALGFGEYLGGLLRRASSARAVAPGEIVSAAVALLS